MKKIVITSFVALFAVGALGNAAHAVGTVGTVTDLTVTATDNKILASKKYVDSKINAQVGSEQTHRKSADGDLQFTGAAAAATNITAAINLLDTAIGDIDTGVQAVSATTGAANGQVAITVDGTTTQVDVKGLGSAAYTDSGAYATAAQGALAATAVQPAAISDMETQTHAASTYAAKATTLAGYGITDGLTSADIAGKANTADLGDLAVLDVVSGGEGGTITDASITTADLAASVVASLGKADTALQASDITGKENTINATNNLSGKMYDATDTLSAAMGKKANTADLGDLALKDLIMTDDIAANSIVTAKILDANVTKAKLASDVQTSLGKADTALQASDITGKENTINAGNPLLDKIYDGAATLSSVMDGKASKAVPAVAGNVATLDASGNLVDGGTLGTAAFTSSTAYATAVQGTKADNAAAKIGEAAMGTTATTLTGAIAEIVGNIGDLGALASEDAVTSALITDGTIAEADLNTTINASLDKADSAVQTIVTGTANGSIKVDGTDVSVAGLGSAAFTASTAYATSAQGALADTALQAAALGNATTIGTLTTDAVTNGDKRAVSSDAVYDAVAGVTFTAEDCVAPNILVRSLTDPKKFVCQQVAE
ncbi:MAG: hypothetical protein LBL75_00040 [Rickettsiales bacterium]|jgi:hypothetical protein|nr:hypothetical protein [Rickettsiales bacterium]